MPPDYRHGVGRLRPLHSLVKLAVAILIIVMPMAGLGIFQSPSDFEHGVVRYATTTPSDAIARLQERIDSGNVNLEFDPAWGYLPAVLDQLKIPRSSQTLVFSKTSLQVLQISPKTPRALYFSDDVYIGAVQGGPILEIAAVDPKLGAIFYTLPQEKHDARPQFQREFFGCLLCHDSAATAGVPGFTMLSVLTDPDGTALSGTPTISVNDRTPFSERWGGWFVTGTHGDQRHRGNLTAPAHMDSIRDPDAFVRRLNVEPGANRTHLRGLFDTGAYLTPGSDLVALMVLAHQTRTHNLMTKASYDVQTATHDDGVFQKTLGLSQQGYSDITKVRIQTAVEPLVRGMLFVWEAALSSKVAGTTAFADEFTKRGPRDSQGRSLRDLDLTKRLFRYPLSYLIHSDAFNALPRPAKEQFYSRLDAILSGEDSNRDFAHLSKADRQAIQEILGDTKPEYVQFLNERRPN
jgi:hypothetical protein